MNILKKERITDSALTFLLCTVVILLICFSDSARQGAKSGFLMCEEIIIPSLLPVLIICKFIITSRLSRVFEILFGRIFEFVFSLPKESAGAVILGLISGYPSGAFLTCSLYERGIIDESEAERIMSFNVCSGVAFSVTAVGTVTYSSTKAGVVFYICNVLSSLCVAYISRFLTKEKAHVYGSSKIGFSSLSDAFCSSVESAVKALALMSAYIIFFSVLTEIIHPHDFLIPLLEITNGICNNTPPPAYAVFFLSFGGICVHLQLLPFLNKMKINYPHFLIGRMSCSVLSFAFYKLYSLVFSESEAVFSNISSPAHSFSSGGIELSLVMITGCAVIILDIESRKIKLHS